VRWIAALLVLFSMHANGAEARILVFAAASLKNALDEVNATYGSTVVASFAASSTLARQIERGAPAQIFFSADAAWMDYLARKDLMEPDSQRNILGNRLVWVVPAASSLPAQPLTALGKHGRLAIADPQHVPAGRYAKSALENLGVWPSIANRVAAASNVRAALALVARGEAPLGIVYETDAQAESKVRISSRIDAAMHPPIVYPAAAVRGATPEARSYLAFLSSPPASLIFEKHGFRVTR
jgi:molybdate transport system substrate-binding protein